MTSLLRAALESAPPDVFEKTQEYKVCLALEAAFLDLEKSLSLETISEPRAKPSMARAFGGSPSKHAIALEGMVKSIVAVIIAAISAGIAMVWKAISWIKDSLTGTTKSTPEEQIKKTQSIVDAEKSLLNFAGLDKLAAAYDKAVPNAATVKNAKALEDGSSFQGASAIAAAAKAFQDSLQAVNLDVLIPGKYTESIRVFAKDLNTYVPHDVFQLHVDSSQRALTESLKAAAKFDHDNPDAEEGDLHIFTTQLIHEYELATAPARTRIAKLQESVSRCRQIEQELSTPNIAQLPDNGNPAKLLKRLDGTTSSVGYDKIQQRKFEGLHVFEKITTSMESSRKYFENEDNHKDKKGATGVFFRFYVRKIHDSPRIVSTVVNSYQTFDKFHRTCLNTGGKIVTLLDALLKASGQDLDLNVDGRNKIREQIHNLKKQYSLH